MGNLVPLSADDKATLLLLASAGLTDDDIEHAVDFTCAFVDTCNYEPHFRELLKMAILYVLGGKKPDGWRAH